MAADVVELPLCGAGIFLPLLLDAVTVKKVDGVAVPRKFSDYTVTVSEDLPEGVTCERLS